MINFNLPRGSSSCCTCVIHNKSSMKKTADTIEWSKTHRLIWDDKPLGKRRNVQRQTVINQNKYILRTKNTGARVSPCQNLQCSVVNVLLCCHYYRYVRISCCPFQLVYVQSLSRMLFGRVWVPAPHKVPVVVQTWCLSYLNSMKY